MTRQRHLERKPEETGAALPPAARGGLAAPAEAGPLVGLPAEEEPIPEGEEGPTGNEHTASARTAQGRRH
jgi:hypothetical protein